MTQLLDRLVVGTSKMV